MGISAWNKKSISGHLYLNAFVGLGVAARTKPQGFILSPVTDEVVAIAAVVGNVIVVVVRQVATQRGAGRLAAARAATYGADGRVGAQAGFTTRQAGQAAQQ